MAIASVAVASNDSTSQPATLRPIRERITSLDVVRGIVVVLMAIDHVRVYSGLPAGGPSPGIFFTRWITNFVAPAFVFFAGTSAYLYGQKVGDVRKLARFLFTRGLWLVFLELTVVRVAWTFNFDFAHYMLAGVLWMIGWCMVLMAGIVFLPRRVILVASLIVIAGHNIADYFPDVLATLAHGSLGWLLALLYSGEWLPYGQGGFLAVLYVIIPWIAVMAAGYVFGSVMQMPRERRRRICLRLGVGCVAAFLILRTINLYGDPRPWANPSSQNAQTQQASTSTATQAQPHRKPMPAVLSFLNTTKYPASLQFLLMTLGPGFLLLGLLDHADGPVAHFFETFGRVPFFFYVLHIPLIHFAAIIVSLLREGSVNAWLFTNHPMANPPPPTGYTWSLLLLYAVWCVVILVLYPLCRWYGALKRRSRSPFLSYL